MISRYTRRPVSHSLEIRGLSRSNLDHHPLPEEADGYLPKYPLHDRQEAFSTCNSSEASGESGRSSVTTSETERSWSGIHSYSGTGISTERSSVFSWGYDEFDKAASRRVQRMFEEIDEELYECRSDGQLGGLREECQQWATRFPHLRILGTQLVCPTDDGYQWVSITEMGAARDATSTVDDKTATELSVHGRKATLSRLGMEAEHTCASDDRPRIIEAEGLMEEYLAFHSRDLDEDWEHDFMGSGRHRCWLPPVSPYRCQRQAILDLLFDDVWRELVGWTGELICRHWEGCISDEEKNTVSPVQPDPRDPYSTLPTVLPRLGQSRLPQLTASLQLQNTKSRGSKHKSRRKSKKQRKPSTSNRVPVGTAVTHQNLNDLIVIHGIPLQQRNFGVLADKTQDAGERVSHRPSSSIIASSKPRSRRTLEQSSSSLLRPAHSARRRNPPPRTLLPLVPVPVQPSTAGPMDEGIRGTRLATASDRQVSPPMLLSRNSLLPPIGVGDVETSSISQHLRPGLRQRGYANSRAHSAVTDEAGASIPRDRLHLLDIFSRPNTTHTYRSDTPYRRSFTILDNIGLSRTGRASLGTDSLDIGVTGISLGISSSSFLDSFTHHTLGHSPIEDEEAPPPALLVPVSVPARSHNRGGLTSRSSRPGL